jgi:hypothetical protein
MSFPEKKRRRLYLVTLILATIIIVAVVSLAYYAASTQVDHMAIVSQDSALKSVPYYHNATYTFTSGNSRWLLVTQANVPGVQSFYVATLYIFKVSSADGRDFSVLGIDTKYNGTSVGGNWIFGIYYYSNNTVVTIGYRFAAAGTYVVDFGLKIQVYSTLLFLPVAQEQIRVATNFMLRYGM